MGLPNKMGDNDQQAATQAVGGLAPWCMAKVKHGKECRDEMYEARWKEYTRLWRGFWASNDANADSERSRIITPALQQAVEMTVSEMEEAVFNKQAWFDISDDYADEERDDVIVSRDLLLQDFDKDHVPDAISKTFLLGAIYGTGIAKIIVGSKEEHFISQHGVEQRSRVAVSLEAVRCDEFVIDPSALSIEEALFVAHQVYKPLQYVKSKQRSGQFKNNYVGPYTGNKADTYGTSKFDSAQAQDGGVLITEYHDLVPAHYIDGVEGEGQGMVEAIVTIANEGILLKVVKNPFLMKDRSFIAYQHDTVPGEFWGRGVCEKGYNPQKALDAEVRARIDALALMSAPMMGADITKLPRNADMRVRPGKTVFTRGRPSETFEPLSFGNPAILAHTFNQSGDLERMVQVGTGAMDSASPMSTNRRNETTGGMSMMQASFIKRSKRTMQNVERQFLDPLIKKAIWRYVQFDGQRYPQDLEFSVNATMGIMAKEVENQQLTQMMGYVPPESPAHSILLKAIFDNTASAGKKELSQAIQAQMQGPSPEEQQMQQMQQQMQMQAAKLELLAKELENQKVEAEIAEIRAKTLHTEIKADLEDDKVEIAAANTAIGAENARIKREGNISKEQVEREKARAKGSQQAG